MESGYRKYSDYSLEMQSHEEPDMVVIHGKGLLNAHEQRFTFVQNPKRGPRSTEIGRTSHSRSVRRPDGLYTVTFRFDAGEKMLLPALLAEVRAVVKHAQADQEVQKRIEWQMKRRKEERNED